MRLLVIVCAVLVSSGSAFASKHVRSEAKSGAKSLKTSVNRFKSECKSDAEKLCSDITPGEGRVASCLSSKEDQLTPECASAKTDLAAQLSRRVEKTEVAFRKTCGKDVQKFCPNTPMGRGRVLDCLDKHADSLSDSCTKFHDELAVRLDEYAKEFKQ